MAASAALAASASFASPLREEPIKKVKWAVLGLGFYAQNRILPNFAQSKFCELTAVISGSPDKAKNLAKQYGLTESKVYSYQNLDRIKDDPDIDVVYVITPPGTHHEFTMRSLKAGKHVVCEKPMASSVKECEEMVAEARRQKRRLGIGYRCHFEPYNMEAVRLCRSGAFGDIRTIRSDHGFVLGGGGSWHSKKALGGHGAISEIGGYSIQALCYLAGADPVEVFGTRDRLGWPHLKEVEDVNHFHFKFPNGIQGFGATAYTWKANNFTVLGTRGNLKADTATEYFNNTFHVNGQPLTLDSGNQWAAQMDHFSECVLDASKTLITPGEMGLRDIRLIETILKSADEGRPLPFKS